MPDDFWPLFDRLLARNLDLGLARNDPSDLNARNPYRTLYAQGVWGGRLARVLKAPDLLAPLWWRRLFGQKPTVVPTTYYHLGMALLDARVARPALRDSYDPLIRAWARQALETRVPGLASHCWAPSFPFLGADLRVREGEACMHYTARLGYLFWRMSEAGFGEEWLDAAHSVASAVRNYFHWTERPSGSMTVSYFPTSDDEIINVGAEAAVLLAAVASRRPEPDFARRACALVQMIGEEQDASGAWDYWTVAYQRRLGRPRAVDHPHTAMVLSALARLACCETLPREARMSATRALRRGAAFYLDQLFTAPGKRPSAEAGASRMADIAGYCEGVIALAEIGEIPQDGSGLPTQLSDEMLRTARDLFYDNRTGDVACGIVWGRRYDLRSIRWGSGLLMEAIARRARVGD